MKFNQRGSALIAVLAVVIVLNMTFAVIFSITRHTTKASGKRRSNIAALNIAEAGKERVLARIRERDLVPPENQRITVYSNEPFGKGSYSVTCSTDTWLDTLYLSVAGIVNQDTARLEILALFDKPWKKWQKGAVTARTAIPTLGDITIDGRDHDTNGVVLGIGGTYGVSSGDTVWTGGDSKIGGGITAPTQPAMDSVTVLINIDTTGYPQTPEEVLGLPPGYLDSYKTGTCPAAFSGITYIESDCSNYEGSGILICHNSTGTASLGNFHGNFKGLIIADEDKHFNGEDTIVGAVIMLGKDVGGNVFGNGETHIRYSSEMLERVATLIPPTGRRGVNVVSWRER